MTEPRSLFLEGPFGAGKTTFAIEALYGWLESGVPPEKIAVLTPQRTLSRPYQLALQDPARGPTGHVSIRTLAGLAKDMVDYHWPTVAAQAGFAEPKEEPRFLTIETAQYAMARFVEEAIERGEFDAIHVAGPEVVRQILDNLNKAALLGIDYREIPEILSLAWGEERPRKRALAYQAAGRVAEAFRQHCLHNNLLDFSLQVEILTRHLLPDENFKAHFFGQYTHLIADNLEEDNPTTHRIIAEWLPYLAQAVLIFDWDGGYRVFIGADCASAESLRALCDENRVVTGSHVMTPPVAALAEAVGGAFGDGVTAAPEIIDSFDYEFHAFYPEMLDWVSDKIAKLVHEGGTSPSEIVILAPFMSDALRWSLYQRLEARDVPVVSHRPSRALRDEPAARALITLTMLAHPQWGMRPPREDVAQALALAIEGMDVARAHLLSRIVYRPKEAFLLSPFEAIQPDMQDRITFTAGQFYDALRGWLLAYTEGEATELDHFFSRLFGEVLSQPGYGLHADVDSGRVVAELVESAKKFRQTLFGSEDDLSEIGRQYISIVNAGLLAALYLASWRDELADAVFMAPAYTFLMRNRPVDYQFWLDVGSTGWWERLYQPLTHPYVLSRAWEPGSVWRDDDEYTHQQDTLYRLMVGLVRRCRKQIILGMSDLGEQGYEQHGPMLRIFQQILRSVAHG
jgi:hypothetical protein